MVKVKEAVLLELARRLGPVIDVVDVVGETRLPEREVVATLVDAKAASPAEIRAALADLIEERLACGQYLGHSAGSVGLTDRGLVAARLIEPGIGTPGTGLRLTLRLSQRATEFAGRLATGSPERDRKLNKSGVALACFYVLALERPSEEWTLTVASMREKLVPLAVMGIGPKAGPSNRIETTEATIRSTLLRLTSILPLKREKQEGDRRREVWYLSAPFPEVRVFAPRSRPELKDWRAVLQILRQRLREQEEGRRWRRAEEEARRKRESASGKQRSSVEQGAAKTVA